MVSKCANPACSIQFRYWHEGQLYQIDRHTTGKRSDSKPLSGPPEDARLAPRVEYFWLCDQCAAAMTLTFEEGKGVRLHPRVRVMRQAS
jgi:hypothetical protein